MKKLFLLTKTLLVMALLCVGASNAVADPYDVTWDFTVAGRWAENVKNGANLISITNASKQFGPDAQEVVSGGVTFNFAAENSAQFRASNSCYLLFNAAGSATTNNVSIDVPNGYRVSLAFNKISSTRKIKYTVDGGEHITEISANHDYDNTSGSTVTFTFWANNPGSLTNMLNSIRLRDVSSVATHGYSVTAKCGETTIDTWNGTGIEEGATYYVPSKAYIYANEKYYVLDDTKYTAPNFGYRQTMGTSDAEFEILYSEYTAGDIVYFAEAETLNSGAAYTTNNASNGKRSHANGSGRLSIGSLPAGVYSFDLGTNDNRAVYFRDNGNDDNNTNTITSVSSGVATGSFILTATTPVVITGYTTDGGGLNQSGDFDYALIRKTGEVVTVSSAGYATYVSTNDLDFTNTDIKAHTAVVNTSTGIVTLNPINKVPAGTPVVLYYEGGKTEGIPFAASTDAVGTNNLVVGPGTAVATGTNPYNYVLDDVAGIGFYKANNVTVATNRAYLQTTYNVAESGARGMRMVFAGDITGINEAALAAEAAQKDGKFIENGKLVIVKNGKKYNANGTEIK